MNQQPKRSVLLFTLRGHAVKRRGRITLRSTPAPAGFSAADRSWREQVENLRSLRLKIGAVFLAPEAARRILGSAPVCRRRFGALATCFVIWSLVVLAPGNLFAQGGPPTIQTQPQGTNALAGGNVTFTVAVAGTTPLHFQW